MNNLPVQFQKTSFDNIQIIRLSDTQKNINIVEQIIEDFERTEQQNKTPIELRKQEKIEEERRAKQLTKELKEQQEIRKTINDLVNRHNKLQRYINKKKEQHEFKQRIKEIIYENKTYRNIDIFYRPVFDHDQPFNEDIYYHEIARLKQKQDHIERMVEELNEDKKTLEDYKTITTNRIYIPIVRNQGGECIARTFRDTPTIVNTNILENLID